MRARCPTPPRRCVELAGAAVDDGRADLRARAARPARRCRRMPAEVHLVGSHGPSSTPASCTPSTIDAKALLGRINDELSAIAAEYARRGRRDQAGQRRAARAQRRSPPTRDEALDEGARARRSTGTHRSPRARRFSSSRSSRPTRARRSTSCAHQEGAIGGGVLRRRRHRREGVSPAARPGRRGQGRRRRHAGAAIASSRRKTSPRR